MSPWVIVAIIIGIVIILAIIRCNYELRHIEVTRYTLKTLKIPTDIRILFVSDLHGRSYGDRNEQLIKMIRDENPELILVGGDVLVSNAPEKDESAMDFLSRLTDIAPVFFADGNHEKAVETLKIYRERNERFRSFLRENGIVNLKNESVNLGKIVISGLDMDYKYYKKFRAEKMTATALGQYLGKCCSNSYNILLSHDPGLFKLLGDYDLVLSGHYHGGTIRMPKGRGAISPQFKILPNYSRGLFKNGDMTMIVTGGAGSHTINIRIFNKPEVVVIDIRNENQHI